MAARQQRAGVENRQSICLVTQKSSKATISLDAGVSNDKKQDLRQSAFTSKQDVKDHICGNLIILQYLKVHKILTTCLALKR